MLKVRVLENFIREQNKLNAFIAQAEIYIVFNKDSFAIKASKVIFVISYIKGLAFY